MNEQFKNYLSIAVIAGILAFSYAAVSYVGTYAKSVEPSSFRSFSVSGEGKTVAVPDVAQFTFTVITQGGSDIAVLQRENTEKANQAIDFAKAKGVDKKDIKTQSYNLEPRYQYFSCPRPVAGSITPTPCPPPEIVGYTVRQTVSVKIRDFDKIGDIISGVVENGANSVSQLNFTVDDPTELENQARAEAIAEAKEKAEAIAVAGGFRVGRLLNIVEGGGAIPFYQTKALEAYGGGIAPAAPAPTIEPGSQEITVNVSLTYGID